MEKYEILLDEVSQILKINANKGEKYIARAGSLVAMDKVFKLDVDNGGTLEVLSRMNTDGDLYIQIYESLEKGELLLAANFLSTIEIMDLKEDKEYIMHEQSFLACSDNIKFEVEFSEYKGSLLASQSMQVRVKGNGMIAVALTGNLYKKILKDNEIYDVSYSNLVLWESKMEYEVDNSLIDIRVRFKGPGEIWIQSRGMLAGE